MTLQGLEEVLTRNGLVLSIGIAGFSQEQEYRVATELMSLKLRGLVLVATEHSRGTRQLLKGAAFPIVEIGDLVRKSLHNVVSFANKAAARAMTHHLIGRGYRRIALATLPLGQSERARFRHAGYQEALQDAGIAYDPQLVIEAEGGHKSGAATLAKVLDSHTMVDAYFGSGDVFALSALIEARRRGIKVPQELAIAGFDDHDICQITDPSLTSIMIPRFEIGRRAAEVIVDTKVPMRRKRKVSIDMGFELVIRGST
jgi:LacI family gluconate utilization system Gnt-I transcriptional repressor